MLRGYLLALDVNIILASSMIILLLDISVFTLLEMRSELAADREMYFCS